MLALAASGLRSNRLELEITETVLMHDDDATPVVLHQLRARRRIFLAVGKQVFCK